MKCHLFATVCSLLVTTATCHAEAARVWHFTGAELKASLEGKLPSPGLDDTQRRLFSSSYGQAYVVGIADQTQGTFWCTRTGVLPHELSDRVYTYLSNQSETVLRTNAGPLVAKALRQTFPCPQTARENQ